MTLYFTSAQATIYHSLLETLIYYSLVATLIFEIISLLRIHTSFQLQAFLFSQALFGMQDEMACEQSRIWTPSDSISFELGIRLFSDARRAFLVEHATPSKKIPRAGFSVIKKWVCTEGCNLIANGSLSTDSSVSSSRNQSILNMYTILSAVAVKRAKKEGTPIPLELNLPNSDPVHAEFVSDYLSRKSNYFHNQYKYSCRYVRYNSSTGINDFRAHDILLRLSELNNDKVWLPSNHSVTVYKPTTKLSISRYHRNLFRGNELLPSLRSTHDMNGIPNYDNVNRDGSLKGMYIGDSFLFSLKLSVDHIYCQKFPNLVKHDKKRKRNDFFIHSFQFGMCLSLKLELILHSWNFLANSLLFESTEQLLLPFIYFDEESGRFSAHDLSFCNKDSSPNIFNFKNAQGFTTRVLSASNEAPDWISRLSSHMQNKLCYLAADFIDDIYAVPDVQISSTDSMDSLINSKFIQDLLPPSDECTHVLPPRFAAIEPELNQITTVLSTAKNCSPVEFSNTSRLQTVLPDHGSSQSPSLVHSHICSSECDCNEKEDLIRDKVPQLPKIFSGSYSMFTKNLFKYDLLDDVKKKTQLLLFDPPLNYKSEGDMDGIDYDTLEDRDIKQVAELCFELMRPGAHVFIFCGTKLFSTWQNAFKKIPSYQCSASPVIILPEPGSHHTCANKTSLTHVPIVSTAFHAVLQPKELSFCNAMKMVDWERSCSIPTRYPGFTNVIDNVPALADNEKIPIACLTSRQSYTKMLHPQHKNIELLKFLIEKYSRPNDIVMDLFVGTGSSAIASMLLPEHRRFFGTEIDANAARTARKRVMDSFLYAAMSNKIPLSISIPDEAQPLIEVLYFRRTFQSMSQLGLSTASHTHSSRSFSELPVCSAIPSFLLLLLCATYSTSDFALTKSSQTTFDKMPSRLRSLFNHTNARQILDYSLAQYKLYISPANENAIDVPLLSSINSIPKNAVVGFVYGAFTYEKVTSTSPDIDYGYGHFTAERDVVIAKSVPLLPPNTQVTLKNILCSYVALTPVYTCPFYHARVFRSTHPNVNCAFVVQNITSRTSIFIPGLVQVVSTREIQHSEEICISSTIKYTKR